MKMLPICLGLVRASECQLGDAFRMLARRHERDFDIHAGCKLFGQWSEARRETANTFIKRYGRAINSDPARVHQALFRGIRSGGFGLLRDLQDALLLAHQARSAWTTLAQAAKELKDVEMDEAAMRCGTEIDRQIDWLCTHIKTAAPQALTVPVDLGHGMKKGLPAAIQLMTGVFVLGLVGLVLRKPRTT